MILEASWDGLDIKYIHLENSPSDALTMYVVNSENFAIDWFDKMNQNSQKDCLEISFNPSLFKQVFGNNIYIATHPLMQLEITEPSMLHLANLLKIEMEAPEILSQQ
ncbi:MAG: hypothetical protein AAF063_17305 [Cyanobacteria bacterium J06643_5]